MSYVTTSSFGLLTAIISYVETRAYYMWWFALSCILDACNHNKLNDNLSTTSHQCAWIIFLGLGSNGRSRSSKRQMLCYASNLIVCAWQCAFGFKINYKKQVGFVDYLEYYWVVLKRLKHTTNNHGYYVLLYLVHFRWVSNHKVYMMGTQV